MKEVMKPLGPQDGNNRCRSCSSHLGGEQEASPSPTKGLLNPAGRLVARHGGASRFRRRAEGLAKHLRELPGESPAVEAFDAYRFARSRDSTFTKFPQHAHKDRGDGIRVARRDDLSGVADAHEIRERTLWREYQARTAKVHDLEILAGYTRSAPPRSSRMQTAA